MKAFFDDSILLNSNSALSLYHEIKGLPIIDYHCHLDQHKIKRDDGFSDIGELWLNGDHYKWRAMRLCGVDEDYITGDKSYHEKFLKYASIIPNLIGNPLYYWTHFELKQLFGINEPLNLQNAEKIYQIANKKLEKLKISDILKSFNVEFIATTDDPCDDLNDNGILSNVMVAPSFRPDKAFNPKNYIDRLEKCVDKRLDTAQDYLDALIERLDYFVSKGCKISDHGFYRFPKRYINDDIANQLFENRDRLNEDEQELFFGWLLVKLSKEYRKRDITMQIHFAVTRNSNIEMFDKCGPDSGFDLIGNQQDIDDLVLFLNQFNNDDRPHIILYTLNDSNLKQIASLTGAFRNLKIGPAWWFNDTVEGIKNNLSIISEYSVLGNHLGMLTDSRSFSSYSRFDFFRRILCDFVGDKVERGEYDYDSAIKLVKDICYNNAKEMVK